MPLNPNQASSLRRGVNTLPITAYIRLLDEQQTLPDGTEITIETFQEWGMSDERLNNISPAPTLPEEPSGPNDDDLDDDSCEMFARYSTIPDFIRFIDEKKIHLDKINECLGVDENHLDDMRKYIKVPRPQINEEKNPTLPTNSSDIYFIGTPKSGKTCVIAAALEHINKSGRLIIDGQQTVNRHGAQYVDYLRKCMSLNCMPISTQSDMTTYMSLKLLADPSDIKSGLYHWNFIEMAGERLKNTYNGVEDGINPNGWFNQSKNRKVINFVVDCDYNEHEMLQDSVLNTAFSQLKEWGVFKLTDVINIIITKIDIPDTMDRNEFAEQKVYRDFAGLYNSLKREQITSGIFGRKKENFALNIIPISIGSDFVLNGAYMKSPDNTLIEEFVNSLLSYTYYWS
ncbi:MAG: hypothetical protein CL823_00840 [Crocinitomicaceae bacterium]|nr:hypothetical protein [Crocinitomicaceae bacterium]|tara:strand:- start:123 stop:1322 length:1200 start_codon:yes stop_codon:yes gene_type:complete